MKTPTELRLSRDRRVLKVSFGETVYHFSAEMLRVMSPSAEVQGHSAAERKTVGGKRDVEIISIEPVGNYAVRIGFDDLHDTGIYTWNWFAEHGRDGEQFWQDYLEKLAEKGLSRDRPGSA